MEAFFKGKTFRIAQDFASSVSKQRMTAHFLCQRVRIADREEGCDILIEHFEADRKADATGDGKDVWTPLSERP